MLYFSTKFALIYTLIFSFLLLFENKSLIKKILIFVSLAYFGFNTKTFKGLLIGILWSFIDGFITGAFLYIIIDLFNK